MNTLKISRRKGITFRQFAMINRQRAAVWHEDKPWGPPEWFIATAGELGEAANIIKKLMRSEDGIVGNNESYQELLEALKEEIADTLTYLFLFADSIDMYMQDEVIKKFNAVSDKHGLPHKILVE